MTTVIDGTTGVNRVTDGSIVQADLGPNVAGNGPAFSAYASSPTSLTSGTTIKVICQSKEYDTGGFFDTTLSRFTPLVAGYYHFTVGVVLATASSALQLLIYKNGVANKQLLNTSPSNVSSASGGVDIYLNGSTDYVEFMVINSVATQNDLTGTLSTYFQGFLARAA